MKYQAENAVSSFFYYMWNAWSKEECKVVFGDMYRHFWDKWSALADKSIFGAAERFFAELSENNQKLLVERFPDRVADMRLKRWNLFPRYGSRPRLGASSEAGWRHRFLKNAPHKRPQGCESTGCVQIRYPVKEILEFCFANDGKVLRR